MQSNSDETIQNPKDQADQLFKQGVQSYRDQQLEESLTGFQEALKVYVQIEDRDSEGHSLNSIGVVHYELGRFLEARHAFQRAIKVIKDINNWNLEARVLNNMGLVYESLEQDFEALGYYKQASNIFEQIGDHFNAGVVLNNIGALHNKMGNYITAIEFYQKALFANQKSTEHDATQRKIIRNLIDAATALMHKTEQSRPSIDALLPNPSTNLNFNLDNVDSPILDNSTRTFRVVICCQ